MKSNHKTFNVLPYIIIKCDLLPYIKIQFILLPMEFVLPLVENHFSLEKNVMFAVYENNNKVKRVIFDF